MSKATDLCPVCGDPHSLSVACTRAALSALMEEDLAYLRRQAESVVDLDSTLGNEPHFGADEMLMVLAHIDKLTSDLSAARSLAERYEAAKDVRDLRVRDWANSVVAGYDKWPEAEWLDACGRRHIEGLREALVAPLSFPTCMTCGGPIDDVPHRCKRGSLSAPTEGTE